MFKLFIVTLLIHLPLLLILGGISFGIARWSLQRYDFGKPLKLAFLLLLFALTAGILYGILRYCGMITFANDNFGSWNWFDSSYRDDGFKYIESCGSAFTGIVAAIIPYCKKEIWFRKEKGPSNNEALR